VDDDHRTSETELLSIGLEARKFGGDVGFLQICEPSMQTLPDVGPLLFEVVEVGFGRWVCE
jgi:hypothetical protein